MKWIYTGLFAFAAMTFSVSPAIARDYGREFATLDGCLDVLADFDLQHRAFEGQVRQYKDQGALLPAQGAEAFENFLAALKERSKIASELKKQILSICAEY